MVAAALPPTARAVALAAALASLLSAPASAEPPDPAGAFADPAVARAALIECLDAAQMAGDRFDRCLGAVTDPCLGRPGGDTSLGMRRCVGVETAGWDRLLNEDYQEALERLDAGAAQALRDAQRKWLPFRDAACAVWLEVHRGGTLALLEQDDCLREETGRRAIAIRAALWTASL